MPQKKAGTTTRKRKAADSEAGTSSAPAKKARVDFSGTIDAGEVATHKPKPKSDDEMNEAAEKIRDVVWSGIKKQLTWKPSCKTGGAKWTYDGHCSDPEVFARVMGLAAPPTWKMKKITSQEFQDIFGSISGSARYNTLYLKDNVNIRWDAVEGTFKVSGTYGL